MSELSRRAAIVSGGMASVAAALGFGPTLVKAATTPVPGPGTSLAAGESAAALTTENASKQLKTLLQDQINTAVVEFPRPLPVGPTDPTYECNWAVGNEIDSRLSQMETLLRRMCDHMNISLPQVEPEQRPQNMLRGVLNETGSIHHLLDGAGRMVCNITSVTYEAEPNSKYAKATLIVVPFPSTPSGNRSTIGTYIKPSGNRSTIGTYIKDGKLAARLNDGELYNMSVRRSMVNAVDCLTTVEVSCPIWLEEGAVGYELPKLSPDVIGQHIDAQHYIDDPESYAGYQGYQGYTSYQGPRGFQGNGNG